MCTAPRRSRQLPHDGNRPLGRALERVPCALLALTLTLVAGCAQGPPPHRGPLWQRPASAQPLAARVRFTGIHVVIDNASDQMWRDVDVRVGRDGDPPPFRFQADAILGRRSLSIGALNFARPDDLRLDPFHYTPTHWAVTARVEGVLSFAEGRLE